MREHSRPPKTTDRPTRAQWRQAKNVAQRQVIYGRDHAGPSSPAHYTAAPHLRRTAFALLRALKGAHHVDAIETAVGHPVDDQRKTNDITDANRYVCGSTIVSKNSDGMHHFT